MDCVVISSDINRTTNTLFSDACAKRNVHFRQLDAAQVEWANLPRLDPGTLLYRAHAGRAYAILERALLNQAVVSLHLDPAHLSSHRYAPLILQQADIPIPKTIFHVNREHIDTAVIAVGGYPVIIKSMGGSHGVGVMRLDSRESLISVVDHLNSRGEHYIMRAYIDTDRSIRLTVLGDRVIDSIAYQVKQGDFRSNVSNPTVTPIDTPDDMRETAVAAVAAMGYAFGGVDVLTDETGFYITEVNFPCNFPRSQLATHTDITGQILNYLIARSKKEYPHAHV